MESLYKKVKGIFIADLVVFPVLFTLLLFLAIKSISTYHILVILLAYLLSILLFLYFTISLILKGVTYVQGFRLYNLNDAYFIPLRLFKIGFFVPFVWHVAAIYFLIENKRHQ